MADEDRISASVFLAVLKWVVGQHASRLLGLSSLSRWRDQFSTFRAAIQMKQPLPPRLQNTIGFLDGTHRPCCRPRGRNNIQQYMYTGYKHVHSIKFLGVSLPNGLMACLHGPEGGSRNDSFLVLQSQLNSSLHALNQTHPATLIADSAFAWHGQVRSMHKAYRQLTPLQEAENSAMKTIRTSVEWFFGIVVRDWVIVSMKTKNKVFLSPIGDIYLAAVFLANCRCCFEGNQISSFFSLPSPNLSEYLKQSQ